MTSARPFLSIVSIVGHPFRLPGASCWMTSLVTSNRNELRLVGRPQHRVHEVWAVLGLHHATRTMIDTRIGAVSFSGTMYGLGLVSLDRRV